MDLLQWVIVLFIVGSEPSIIELPADTTMGQCACKAATIQKLVADSGGEAAAICVKMYST